MNNAKGVKPVTEEGIVHGRNLFNEAPYNIASHKNKMPAGKKIDSYKRNNHVKNWRTVLKPIFARSSSLLLQLRLSNF